jgi:hypothetical protein
MPAAARSETVAELKARIAAMQSRTLGVRTLPTAAAVAPLLPGGALRSGVAYAVPGSLALAMLLLAGPSAAGAWVGVVGIPEFGVEAAGELGIALDRLVLVPEPGEHWLAVTAQLAEVLPVVLVRPPERGASPAETARLASRLRQRGATLVVAGRWSGSEAVLEVTGGSWSGIGAGWGYLSGRELEVAVSGTGGVRSTHRLPVATGFRIAAPAPRTQPAPLHAVEAVG